MGQDIICSYCILFLFNKQIDSKIYSEIKGFDIKRCTVRGISEYKFASNYGIFSYIIRCR